MQEQPLSPGLNSPTKLKLYMYSSSHRRFNAPIELERDRPYTLQEVEQICSFDTYSFSGDSLLVKVNQLKRRRSDLRTLLN